MSSRRRVCIFLALLFLLLLGWIGWEQYQLIQRQAAAPVVSVAEDGTVRINGHLIEITPEGLPGPGLAALEGGPPVELPGWQGDTTWLRKWQSPRTGVALLIFREVRDDGSVWYEGLLQVGIWLEHFPATLEYRGQRWWLGEQGPLGGPSQRRMAARCLRPDDHQSNGHSMWVLDEGRMELYFDWYGPLKRHSELLTTVQLHSAHVSLLEVKAGTAAEKGESW